MRKKEFGGRNHGNIRADDATVEKHFTWQWEHNENENFTKPYPHCKHVG